MTRIVIAIFYLMTLFLSAVSAQSIVKMGIKNKLALNKSRQEIGQKLRQQDILNSRHAKNAAAKPTSVLAERLVASSNYNLLDTMIAPIGLTDSANYIYSASRSSIFNYNTMSYDNSYYVLGDIIFGFGWDWGFKDRNNAPNMLCDTMTTLSVFDSGFVLNISGISYSHYDTNNNVLKYEVVSYFDDQFINQFNSIANIDTSYYLSFTGTSLDTIEVRRFFYNTSQQITADSTTSYISGIHNSPYETWQYSYNTAGNMTAAHEYVYDSTTFLWSENQRYKFYYYSDSTLQIDSVFAITDSVIGLVYVDSFGYNSGISYPTTMQKRTFFDTVAGTMYITKKHVGSLGLPDTMISSSYFHDSLNGRAMDVFTYDSYNEPVTDTFFNYHITNPVTGAGWFDSVAFKAAYYYYQTYPRNSNGVPSITGNSPSVIKIYPNPTNGDINIAQSSIKQGTRVAIKIVNSLGQLIRTKSLPWLHETESIPLNDVAPGTYWLILQDAAGNTYHGQFIKQ